MAEVLRVGISDLLTMLSSPDESRRVLAVVAIGMAAVADCCFEAVIKDEPELPRLLVTEFGPSAIGLAVGPLMNMVEDPSRDVRTKTAGSLRLIGGKPVREAVEK